MAKDILSYGIGTLAAFAVLAALAFLFVSDITQKKHGVLRTRRASRTTSGCSARWWWRRSTCAWPTTPTT
jgi:hypothetical protein